MSEHLPYILLIDDDDDDREMLSTALELKGIKTRSFESGEKALYFLKLILDTSNLPTLIILDYNMPRINGEQMLLLIKGNKEIRNIPVVMYSTHMSTLFKKALIDLGAFNCFIKPITYLEFNARVQQFKDLAAGFTKMENLL